MFWVVSGYSPSQQESHGGEELRYLARVERNVRMRASCTSQPQSREERMRASLISLPFSTHFAAQPLR